MTNKKIFLKNKAFIITMIKNNLIMPLNMIKKIIKIIIFIITRNNNQKKIKKIIINFHNKIEISTLRQHRQT